MGKRKTGSGSGIRNEQPGSYFRELRNQILWVKILKLFYVNLGWEKFGSGMENIRTRALRETP
jgi:hypothetical protein